MERNGQRSWPSKFDIYTRNWFQNEGKLSKVRLHQLFSLQSASMAKGETQYSQSPLLILMKELSDWESVITHVSSAFLASETIVATLTACMEHLGKDPNLFAQISEEARAVYPNDTVAHTPEQVEKLEFTERVFKEVLRRDNLILFLPERRCFAPFTLGGHEFPADSVFIVNLPAIHHSEEYGRDTFDPDNFLPQREQARPTYSWVSFGFGVRKQEVDL